MLFMVDSADLNGIKKCNEFFPISGVTTNPTIISSAKSDFKKLLLDIRNIIGEDKMLHVQATADTAEEIVKEAEMLRDFVGGNFYIKIPITAEGLKAMSMCKARGIGVTATAIFTQQQALMAARAGADFVAPYINRLDNIISDGVHVVEEIVEMFNKQGIKSQVLAASFKTCEQVHKVAMVGAHSVTINPDLFNTLIYHPLTMYAIDAFESDWSMVYGNKKVADLLAE
jgi:fructose-6-phosphate aldolase 2